MKAGGPTAFFGRLPPPTAEERAAVRRAAPWVGLALALGMAPAALVLPVWVTVLLAALLGFKTLAVRRGWSVGARVVLPLAAAVLGAWGLGFAAGWMRAPAVLAFFCLVLALKWLEADARGHRRDRIVLLLAAGVLAALGALQQPALVSLALLVGYAFALAAALIALQGADRPARRAGTLLALALPPAALLFVLTPRVPGPLWDFGLALGLPIAVQAPRSGPGLGARDSLEPGTTAGDGLDSGTALVARFDGWVPPAAALYWRGPVFTRYDGQRWLAPAGAGSRRERMAGGHRRSADWLARVQTRGQALGYTLRVAGHGGPWLYALDLPGRLPAESYITHDGQLLSMTPVNGETHYATVAWLDATVDVGGLAADEQAALLELPPGASPRLQALGHELAAREAQPAARAAAVLAFFSEGGFRVDAREAGVRGPDAYDRFAYERRAGGADQFAGAFVLLARAAGLPARLVTGYHGGRLMGSSDYVLVKQSHAHAWAELWLPGRGWSRFDPADALRTPRDAAARAAPAAPAATRPGQAASAAAPAAAEAAPSAWRRWLAALDSWVLHYDAPRRRQLVEAGAQGGSGWLVLALRLGAALALVAAAAWGWRRWRDGRGSDPLLRAWVGFRARLAAAGVESRGSECPSALRARLAALPAPWAAPAAALVDEWLAARYAPAPPDAAARLRLRLARRLAAFRPLVFAAADAAPGS